METYYQSGAANNGTTKFGYGGNMTEVAVSGNKTAFAIYHGGTPNYYQSGAAHNGKTLFGFGGNMTEVDADNSINVSYDQFQNGSNTLYGSGTITTVTSGDIASFRF
jgi:3-deoxy-D-arabino-heptulosonate 7-phosphate (DAHP) synthase